MDEMSKEELIATILSFRKSGEISGNDLESYLRKRSSPNKRQIPPTTTKSTEGVLEVIGVQEVDDMEVSEPKAAPK